MEDWRSPLMKACFGECSTERVRQLLEQGADPNYGGTCKCTPLETVCSENNVECAQLLLEFGADPNLNSPLVTACSKNNFECAKLLLEFGADPNLVDKYGDSPLSSAWGRGYYECTKLLLDSGAHVCYGEWYRIFWRLTDILLIHYRSDTFGPNHKKILDLILIQREEMEERLYDNIHLPRDMIKEIHSFL